MPNTEAPTMNRWLPVVGGVSMNLALGSLYAWSTFVTPLEAEFGWTRTQTSWVFSIAIVTFAISFVLAGRIQDRRGPRIPAAVGGTLVGLGFILASFTSSLPYLYVAFGFLVGLGNGFGYATPIPVGSKWFPDKRGLVVGLMVAGYGGGSAIFIPVGNALIARLGWRPTFQIIGVILFLMCMLGTWLLKNPPAGYRPEGWSAQAAPAERTLRDIPTGEMVRMPTFYALWVAYCLGTTAGLMTISQLVPFAQSAGMAAGVAGLAGAIGSASGRIVSGWMSDLVGRLSVLRLMILASAIAMPALFIWREQAFPLLPARLRCLLVFRYATVGVCHHRCRLLRHEESRPELRTAVHGVRGCGPHRSDNCWPCLRCVRRLPLRLLHRGRPRRGCVALPRVSTAASPRGGICADLSRVTR